MVPTSCTVETIGCQTSHGPPHWYRWCRVDGTDTTLIIVCNDGNTSGVTGVPVPPVTPVPTHTVAHPGAVVVELGDAAVADGAMLGADWLPDLGRTRGARSESVSRSERRSEHGEQEREGVRMRPGLR